MSITKLDLVERARAIAPKIAARSQQTEAQRAPHDDTIADLMNAELFQTLVPKRWGGHELGLDAQLEIVETISAACSSAGWITAFYIGHNFMVTKFGERAQAEVYADRPFCLLPATTNSLMTTKKVARGWEISGRATWGSGIMHADWALVGGQTEEGRHVFLIPASDTRVVDVWHMSGMAGTGSNDFLVENVFVPEHRGLPIEEFMAGRTRGSSIHDNPLYSMALMPFIYCEVSGVFAGGLNGALKAYDGIVQKRVTTHGQQVAREKPHVHIQLGEAATNAAIADELAHGLVRQANALIGQNIDLATRLRMKAQMGFVVDHCRRSVNMMINQAGSSSFRTEAPLQRFFRDLNTIAIHAFWDWEVAREQVGRSRLGLEPNNPLV